MRKIEVHKRNIELFGEDHVNSQKEFFAWEYESVEKEANRLLDRYGILGLRFDLLPGREEDNYLLPYLPNVTDLEVVKEAFFENVIMKEELTIIVCEHIRPSTQLLNFVAEKVDDEHIFIEYSTAPVAQRHMYDDPSLLHHLAIGPNNIVFWQGYCQVRSFRPEYTWKLGLDKVYKLFFMSGVSEMIGTVLNTKRVIVW